MNKRVSLGFDFKPQDDVTKADQENIQLDVKVSFKFKLSNFSGFLVDRCFIICKKVNF